MDKRYVHEAHRLQRLGEMMPFTLPEIKDTLGRLAMENVGGRRRRGTYTIHSDNVLETHDFDLVIKRKHHNSFLNLCLRLQYLQYREDGTYGFIHLLLRDTLVYGFSLPHIRADWLYTDWREPSPALALGAIQDWRSFMPLRKLAEDRIIPSVQRLCVIDGLVRLGDPRVVEALINVLLDNDWTIRSRAAHALGIVGDHRAVEPLMRTLADGEAYVRSSAADALGKLGDPAVEPLTRSLMDSNSNVRSGAADALGKLGDHRAVEPLVRALADREANVRFFAAKALGELGNPLAVKPLIRTLADPDLRIHYIVARALHRIGTQEALAAVANWRARGGDKRGRGAGTSGSPAPLLQRRESHQDLPFPTSSGAEGEGDGG